MIKQPIAITAVFDQPTIKLKLCSFCAVFKNYTKTTQFIVHLLCSFDKLHKNYTILCTSKTSFVNNLENVRHPPLEQIANNMRPTICVLISPHILCDRLSVYEFMQPLHTMQLDIYSYEIITIYDHMYDM